MGELVRLSPLPSIKEVLKLYNITALKRLSQNFLLQQRTADRIVNAAGNLKDCEVCEIGPGPGGITRSILMREPKKVLVVEKDIRFKPVLEALQESACGKLDVIYADILGYDLSQAFDQSMKKNWEDAPPDIHIIGNLPFNISNVLIFEYLKDMSLRRSAWSYGRVCLTLTFQHEVAERIVSDILLRTRSRISVMCQNWCKVSYKFKISKKAFLPKPEVDAAVVHFEPLAKPIIDLDFDLIEKVVRTIFNCRNKYSLNPTKHLFPKEKEDLANLMFYMADVRPTIRPFELTNEEWNRLCLAYKELCEENKGVWHYNFRGCKKTREKDWKKFQQEVTN